MTDAVARPRRTGRLVLALVLAMLAFAGWRALSLGVADRLARPAPAVALAWRGAHPDALVRASTHVAPDPAAATGFARRAIRASPLDGRGYRQLAALTADAALSQRLLEIAVARSPRDVRGLAALAQAALVDRRFGDAVRHLDQMLRVEGDELDRLTPLLHDLAATPQARAPLLEVLAASPPWRAQWLSRLARDAPQPAAVAPLFDMLRAAPGGLRDVELDVWLERLLREGLFAPAYLAWVDALPPERRARLANLHNGDFEQPLTDRGFDWRLATVPGARIARAQTAGMVGTHALQVEFAHRRVPFRHLRQPLLLGPGRYRLAGRVRLDALDTPRGLVWTIECAGRGAPVAQSEAFAGNAGWRTFAMDFSVPASGCAGQWLSLRLPARIPAEQRIGGSAWFDELSVKKLPRT